MLHLVRAGELSPAGLPGPVPEGPGVSVRWLVAAEFGGASRAVVGELAIEPGGQQPLHRHHNADEAAFVISRPAGLISVHGESPLPAGTLALSSKRTWHGIRAGDRPVTVLFVHSGESHLRLLTAELADGPVQGDPPRMIDSSALERMSVHNPQMGFYNMAASFLVGDDGLGGADFLIGAAVYGHGDPNGGHALHRHPVGEEFLYVRDGTAAHLTLDGDIPMGAGDIVFIPAGEWHGIWNKGSGECHSVFGYLGHHTIDGAGYELA